MSHYSLRVSLYSVNVLSTSCPSYRMNISKMVEKLSCSMPRSVANTSWSLLCFSIKAVRQIKSHFVPTSGPFICRKSPISPSECALVVLAVAAGYWIVSEWERAETCSADSSLIGTWIICECAAVLTIHWPPLFKCKSVYTGVLILSTQYVSVTQPVYKVIEITGRFRCI